MASSQPQLTPPAAKRAAQSAPPSQPPPPAAPHVQPLSQPRNPVLATAVKPSDHFTPGDPPTATVGVRQDAPATSSRSVPADPSLVMAGNPLSWTPFPTNVP